jgi:serine/threonine protein kinase
MHKDYERTELLDILYQCSSGLAHLHERQIAHRDLKPENILIKKRHSDEIHVVLGDFGFAKQSTAYSSIVGTPFYQAPEVRALGDDSTYSTSGPRSRSGPPGPYHTSADIWSLGATMYELAYAPDRTIRRQNLLREVEHKIARTYGDGLLHLLREMLQDDPKQRPSAQVCRRRARELRQQEASRLASASTSASQFQACEHRRKQGRTEGRSGDNHGFQLSAAGSTATGAKDQLPGSHGVGSSVNKRDLNPHHE